MHRAMVVPFSEQGISLYLHEARVQHTQRNHRTSSFSLADSLLKRVNRTSLSSFLFFNSGIFGSFGERFRARNFGSAMVVGVKVQRQETMEARDGINWVWGRSGDRAARRQFQTLARQVPNLACFRTPCRDSTNTTRRTTMARSIRA